MLRLNQLLSCVPSPGAWLRAAKLAIPAYGCATIGFSFAVWNFLLIGGIAGLFGGGLKDLIHCFLFSALILFLSLLWFIVWAEVYTFGLKLLWKTPPKWLQLPANSILAKRDFTILTLSMLPVTVVFLSYVFLNVSLRQNLLSPPPLRLSYDAFLLKYFWLWYVSAASLYHQWPKLKAKRLSSKKLQQSKRAT